MKKLWCILLSAVLVMGLAGCSSNAAGAYKAGTYTGTGTGRNGDIQVEVTFSDTAITKVEVKEQQETAGIADAALTELPKKIVEAQSLGVAAVAGATYTSNGILAAVADAVAKAGGDAAKLKEVKPAQASSEVVDKTADVVVVGGGGAGMAAAVRLQELGKKVILVEKSGTLGGTIAVSGGNQVVTGSKLQATAGVSDDSADSMVADFMKNGNDKNVPELLNLYAANVGAATDWLHESCKVQYNMDGGLHQLAEYSHNRELAYQGGGAGFAATFRTAVENSGAEVLLSTRAKSLTAQDGKVTGITAVAADGVTYQIKATAVVLATGGYGANEDLLSDDLKSSLYYGLETSTGDGVVMASADGINAATRLMEYGKRYPNGIEVSQGRAKSTIAGNIAAWKMSAILVNSTGERVVNEKASNRTILETEVQQPGAMLYLLLDQQTFDVWKTKLVEAGITEDAIDGYLANNGSGTPVFAHGDTLAAVAETVGMDAKTLQGTVDTYNGAVDAGVDKAFGRAADYLTMKIGSGPYYLVEQKPRFATTMGGLVVDTSLQVMNQSGSPISGLYAAGEVVGGVMGDDSPSGANNGWALTSGKLAAEAVAAAN